MTIFLTREPTSALQRGWTRSFDANSALGMAAKRRKRRSAADAINEDGKSLLLQTRKKSSQTCASLGYCSTKQDDSFVFIPLTIIPLISCAKPIHNDSERTLVRPRSCSLLQAQALDPTAAADPPSPAGGTEPSANGWPSRVR